MTVNMGGLLFLVFGVSYTVVVYFVIGFFNRY